MWIVFSTNGVKNPALFALKMKKYVVFVVCSYGEHILSHWLCFFGTKTTYTAALAAPLAYAHHMTGNG